MMKNCSSITFCILVFLALFITNSTHAAHVRNAGRTLKNIPTNPKIIKSSPSRQKPTTIQSATEGGPIPTPTKQPISRVKKIAIGSSVAGVGAISLTEDGVDRLNSVMQEDKIGINDNPKDLGYGETPWSKFWNFMTSTSSEASEKGATSGQYPKKSNSTAEKKAEPSIDDAFREQAKMTVMSANQEIHKIENILQQIPSNHPAVKNLNDQKTLLMHTKELYETKLVPGILPYSQWFRNPYEDYNFNTSQGWGAFLRNTIKMPIRFISNYPLESAIATALAIAYYRYYMKKYKKAGQGVATDLERGIDDADKKHISFGRQRLAADVKHNENLMEDLKTLEADLYKKLALPKR